MDLNNLIKTVDQKAYEYFEEQIKQELKKKDRQWLEEQLLFLIIQKEYKEQHVEIGLSRKKTSEETLKLRKERIGRIKTLNLNSYSCKEKVEEYKRLNREKLIARKLLINPPHKGLDIITPEQRSEEGNVLLQEAKDFLYALLFCNKNQNVNLERSYRDYLTVTIATKKVVCLENLMLAVTEFPVKGIWHDPEGVSDDEGASNIVMQVEFGEDKNGNLSDAMMSTLGLLNNLEINEEILYCRIEHAQKSSLI